MRRQSDIIMLLRLRVRSKAMVCDTYTDVMEKRAAGHPVGSQKHGAQRKRRLTFRKCWNAGPPGQARRSRAPESMVSTTARKQFKRNVLSLTTYPNGTIISGGGIHSKRENFVIRGVATIINVAKSPFAVSDEPGIVIKSSGSNRSQYRCR